VFLGDAVLCITCDLTCAAGACRALLPGYGNERAPVVQDRVDGRVLASHQDSHQANGGHRGIWGPSITTKGRNNQMNRFTKTAAIAAIATFGVLGTTGAASAATINHGQCVSGAVKAGVEGAAFTAIAKNNSLVGPYGSATCPAVVVPLAVDKADADVTWTYDSGDTHITGRTTFSVDSTGGKLTYTSSDNVNNVLYGTITPGSYHKSGNTAIFSGTIDAGSSANYLGNPLGHNYFFVKIVEGQPDMIAVLANQVVPGTWITSATDADALAATIAYPMGPGTAGIVTSGDLTIN
jgi:hypothetical protein